MRRSGHATPRVSPRVLRAFAWWTRRDLHKNFDAVRVLDGAEPEVNGDEAFLVVLNHAAWWDPLVALLLARHFWPERRHFAPIDAEALEAYPIFERLGFFGLTRGDHASHRRFLQTSGAILADPGAILWITPQGRFADVRARPTAIAPGTVHAARTRRERPAAILPLALEYGFWEERRPGVFAAFGPAVRPEKSRSVATETAEVGRALETTQDRLARAVVARDPDAFRILDAGRTGIHPVYDAWRRLRARLRGRRYTPRHSEVGSR